MELLPLLDLDLCRFEFLVDAVDGRDATSEDFAETLPLPLPLLLPARIFVSESVR